MRPRLMPTQPQLHSLHLGESWPKVSQEGEGCWGCTQSPTPMFPIPGAVRTVESASQEMVPEDSGSRHYARTAEVSGSRGPGRQEWSRFDVRTPLSGWRLNGGCQGSGSG